MPSVQRHGAVERWFFDVARIHLGRRPRTGIHVSDLLTPRKAYWAKVAPKAPTDREVLYFLAGRGHEEWIVALAGLGHHRKSWGEWLGLPGNPYAPGEGVRYELDVLAPTDSDAWTPIEMKTNRRPTIIPPERVLEEYGQAVAQLGMYVAIMNQRSDPSLRTGYLVEMHLMARNLAPEGGEAPEWARVSRPEFLVYQIDWTDDEIHAIRVGMADGKAALESAWDARDHRILPECPDWMCGEEHVRRSAPKCPKCGNEYAPGEPLGGGRKRGVLKFCPDDRTPLGRTEETVFVPTCRWWSECLPAQWAKHHGTPPGVEEPTDGP